MKKRKKNMITTRIGTILVIIMVLVSYPSEPRIEKLFGLALITLAWLFDFAIGMAFTED